MFVKVCGLSTPESVRAAVEAGAQAVGFVLTPSPREVSPEQVRALLAEVPAEVAAVGVFRHEDVDQAAALAEEAGLSWIQLHGERTPQEVDALQERGFSVIRAVRMDDPDRVFADWGEELLLVDASVPGSGESWDYASVRERCLDSRRWLLAGGLDAGNVAAAAETAAAWGVDVSSGVESSRGVKDLEKIRAFVAAALAG
ncbi:phosphoribosylanthranilate isomerase [Arthrobacter woluwensis]|uniref:N-(5'-phosphoribosyl)anthranilate isomerase n=1 Tax=Arthrobacter woluwensis TaxID=156980 RepID=A0A1H4KUT6_9MICC|nr:phosphoribosylanthranilate isomerase [Arthrobacter woluwensis]SEB62267.1 phosphoribosylanthranilate isomerase [Arthrobacter woluwensis]